MKTRILFLAAIVSLATTIHANNSNKSTSKIGVTNRFNDAVTFVERGVKFYVFLNGEFDFNTHGKSNNYYDIDGRRYNNGVRIERDYDGRVRRVGNVFINYNFRGDVSRIGGVYLEYRFGQLSRVGNLFIDYDRWGYPHFRGVVKHNRYYNDYYENESCGINIRFGTIFDYDDVYFYRNDFTNNYRQYKEDNDYYYYRATPNARVNQDRKLLRRRKSATKNRYYNKNTKKNRQFAEPEQTGRSRRSR